MLKLIQNKKYNVTTKGIIFGLNDNVAVYDGYREATPTSNEIHYFKTRNGILCVLKDDLESRVSEIK